MPPDDENNGGNEPRDLVVALAGRIAKAVGKKPDEVETQARSFLLGMGQHIRGQARDIKEIVVTDRSWVGDVGGLLTAGLFGGSLQSYTDKQIKKRQQSGKDPALVADYAVELATFTDAHLGAYLYPQAQNDERLRDVPLEHVRETMESLDETIQGMIAARTIIRDETHQWDRSIPVLAALQEKIAEVTIIRPGDKISYGEALTPTQHVGIMRNINQIAGELIECLSDDAQTHAAKLYLDAYPSEITPRNAEGLETIEHGELGNELAQITAGTYWYVEDGKEHTETLRWDDYLLRDEVEFDFLVRQIDPGAQKRGMERPKDIEPGKRQSAATIKAMGVNTIDEKVDDVMILGLRERHADTGEILYEEYYQDHVRQLVEEHKGKDPQETHPIHIGGRTFEWGQPIQRIRMMDPLDIDRTAYVTEGVMTGLKNIHAQVLSPLLESEQELAQTLLERRAQEQNEDEVSYINASTRGRTEFFKKGNQPNPANQTDWLGREREREEQDNVRER